MFKVHNKKYYAAPNFEDEQVAKQLPGGSYIAGIEQVGMSQVLYFKPFKFTGKLIPFEGKYKDIADKIAAFFSPEAQSYYKSFDFPHLMGTLLHGRPGTGKSCFIRYVCKQLIKKYDAAVIYVYDFNIANILNHVIGNARERATEQPLVIVMEEMDSYIENRSTANLIANITDGSTGVENFMLLATTNHLKMIPENLKNRPSRFNMIEEFDVVDHNVVEDFVLTEMGLLTKEQGDKARERIQMDELIKGVYNAKLPVDFIKNILLDILVYDIPLDNAIERAQTMYGIQVKQQAEW